MHDSLRSHAHVPELQVKLVVPFVPPLRFDPGVLDCANVALILFFWLFGAKKKRKKKEKKKELRSFGIHFIGIWD